MSVTLEELIKHLSYKGCSCPPEYVADIKIFNGVCSKHGGRLLMDGKSIEEQKRSLLDRLRGKKS